MKEGDKGKEGEGGRKRSVGEEGEKKRGREGKREGENAHLYFKRR